MVVKLACNRSRTPVWYARPPVPVTRSRNLLAAVWRRDPVSGQLELEWRAVQPADQAAA